MNAWLTVADIRAMRAEMEIDENGVARALESSIKRSVSAWAAHRRKRHARMEQRGTAAG